ncbi:hypothetical protein CPC08DRAFT_712794 [Agrocybe pediades]|nr:hypothetical protein CPC08DRAFT_712794 [Agrocybe pediades]
MPGNLRYQTQLVLVEDTSSAPFTSSSPSSSSPSTPSSSPSSSNQSIQGGSLSTGVLEASVISPWNIMSVNTPPSLNTDLPVTRKHADVVLLFKRVRGLSQIHIEKGSDLITVSEVYSHLKNFLFAAAPNASPTTTSEELKRAGLERRQAAGFGHDHPATVIPFCHADLLGERHWITAFEYEDSEELDDNLTAKWVIHFAKAPHSS